MSTFVPQDPDYVCPQCGTRTGDLPMNTACNCADQYRAEHRREGSRIPPQPLGIVEVIDENGHRMWIKPAGWR